jgi:hypothetical protein
VDYKSTISPVCLPSANSNAEQYADKDATIIGWGTLIEGENLKLKVLEHFLEIFHVCFSVF